MKAIKYKMLCEIFPIFAYDLNITQAITNIKTIQNKI